MSKLSIWLVVGVFLIVNIVFNYNLWQKLYAPYNNPDIYSSDSTITELLTETSYTNLKVGRNPFTPTDKLFYPFGMDFTLNDPSTTYVVPFVFLRPFLSISQSMILSVLIFMFAASVAMYGLLRYLKVSSGISLIFSLAYSYMPYISHRLQGHYGYIAHFLFPLVYLLMHYFFNCTQRWKKVLTTLLISISLVLALYGNFYYFITIVISIVFYGSWYFISSPYLFGRWLVSNLFYFILMIVSFLLFASPWLLAVKAVMLFEGNNPLVGYGGAMHYSADILGWLTPNQYNTIYWGFAHLVGSTSPVLSRFEQYFLHNWNGFVYPGLILLSVYGWIALGLKQHKLPRQLWQTIRVPFFVSLLLFILSCGPFLKIFSVWHINLDGVEVLFPLPFLLLRSLPVMSNLRVPVRMSVGFVFFGCLIGAYVVQYLLRHVTGRKRYVVIGLLLAIFVIDQNYYVPTQITGALPINIYSYIKNQPRDATVMEIPLTVRDGLQYKGFVHAISPMEGTMLHGQPIIGGYFARVGQPIFDYYDKLPFVGYMLDITDLGNYSQIYQQPQEPHIYPFTLPKPSVQAELDFLNVGYVIVKNDEPYSNQVDSILKNLDLSKVMDDNAYTLYQRDINKVSMNFVKFGDDLDFLHIGRGLSSGESGTKVMVETRAQVFLSVDNPAEYKSLHIYASANGTTEMEIYVNRHHIGNIAVTSTQQELRLPVVDSLIPHVNSIVMVRSGTSNPVYFSKLGLE